MDLDQVLGGGALLYLKVVGNFPGIDPIFLAFSDSIEKIRLPELIWPKVGLIFQHNLSFVHFEGGMYDSNTRCLNACLLFLLFLLYIKLKIILYLKWVE